MFVNPKLATGSEQRKVEQGKVQLQTAEHRKFFLFNCLTV
jgi:hypothetical protein